MKRITPILLTLMLCVGILSGCGGTDEPGTSAPEPAAAAPADTAAADNPAPPDDGQGDAAGGDGPYAGYDLSEPVTIHLYMVGDTAADLDEVLGVANAEYFQPMLNTTLEMVFLPWSDYEVKYPLVLAGGDDVDIIFTGSWCFYEQEAAKGAFLKLTDDFIEQWMPNVSREQPPNSWLHVLIGDGIYGVPGMSPGQGGYRMIAIRDDLREKYNLPEITDWDTFEQYLFTIADNETGIQALASAGENHNIRFLYMQYLKVLLTTEPIFFAWHNSNNQDPAPDDLTFFYMSEWYTDFAMKMAEWAERGVWSRNVMNNTIPTADSFQQGSSATVVWNASVFAAGREMENNGVGKAGYYDICANHTVRASGFGGDLWAITTSSENPERAALTLDLMKTNLDLVNLLHGGIEGRHYIDQGDGYFKPGPEESDYSWNNWAWALSHPNTLRRAFDETTPPQQVEIETNLARRVQQGAFSPLIDGFLVDTSSISTEWAVISSLIEEYNSSFECGIFGSQTEAKLQEFRDKLVNAGVDKLTDQFRSQYATFYAMYS